MIKSKLKKKPMTAKAKAKAARDASLKEARINGQTYQLIKEITDLCDQLFVDLSGYPAESRVLASKIMKEWAGSIAAGNCYNKNYIKSDPVKKSNFMKNLAEFIEK